MELSADGLHLLRAENDIGRVQWSVETLADGRIGCEQHEAVHHVISIGVENLTLPLEPWIIQRRAEDQKRPVAITHGGQRFRLHLALGACLPQRCRTGEGERDEEMRTVSGHIQ